MPEIARKYKTEVINLPVNKKAGNKPCGKKSEAYALTFDEAHKILSYFAEKKSWIHYLAFTLEFNAARRVGDTLALTWNKIYNPSTGRMYTYFGGDAQLLEQKTSKLSDPKINSACQAAINLYIEKTNCDPSKNNYGDFVFLQLSGTHPGKRLSYDGFRKALKKAAFASGIEHNVATHSMRKGAGMASYMLHPEDPNRLDVIQTMLNHSDPRVTRRYIGQEKKEIDKYYDDIGDAFTKYVVEGKEYIDISDKPIISVDSNDMIELLKLAYAAGGANAGETDAMVHVSAVTNIISELRRIAK